MLSDGVASVGSVAFAELLCQRIDRLKTDAERLDELERIVFGDAFRIKWSGEKRGEPILVEVRPVNEQHEDSPESFASLRAAADYSLAQNKVNETRT